MNYFADRLNNGFAEGVNNKVKLIQRRAFGFRKFDSLRLHILVAFEPNSAYLVCDSSRLVGRADIYSEPLRVSQSSGQKSVLFPEYPNYTPTHIKNAEADSEFH